MGSLKGDIKEVIDYEMFITSTSDIKPASLLCVYHGRDFSMLSENQKEILFGQHHKKIIIKDSIVNFLIRILVYVLLNLSITLLKKITSR
jgi:hypothetical protein